MSIDANDDVLIGYAASSRDLIARFESLSSKQLYAPMADLLPTKPSRILDIGAGTGRDAAWLARQGHDVTAVEPVDELRQAGMRLHDGLGIDWRDDRLPDLHALQGRTGFDLILLVGVWQHLNDHQREIAMRRLAALAAPSGLIIMSLRHGRGAPNRRVYDVRPADTIAAASSAGLALVRQCEAESIQPENRDAGVCWTWLAFRSNPFRSATPT
jgi:SAM-dependent methyltransferase